MIRAKLTDSEMVETLTNANPKPNTYNGQSFNFTALNDRVFEILLYQIFKARIESGDRSIGNKFDNVLLMQGVGERGRDCFLTKKGKNVGVIQCKQINKNLTKPETQKELLKFTLHYVLDSTLISDIENFTYYFAVSKGFAETSINLMADFNNNYDNNEIETYCNSLIKSVIAFKDLKYTDIKTTVENILKKIKVVPIIPADLTQYLFDHDHLIRNFFRVLTVTDNTLLEGIIENYLSPILSTLYNKKDRPFIDFSYRFKDYLQRVYSYYSSARTLVFGNQQKKLEDFYYPLNLECLLGETKNKQQLINTLKYEDDFLPEFKKVIIVDNGGMGKSTVMKWLFLSVIKQSKGIPIFIELRKLKFGKTIIDEIISELNPIDEEVERDVVTKLIAKGNFIFFFDGFDEISEEDREFVTTDLQTFISKSDKNLFIMTSRPEMALNTFADFKEFSIKKLTKNGAYALIKKIGNNSDKSLRLIKKIEENDIANIEDFLQSPLLVSLLYKKFEHRENIPLHLQEFYYDVFEALYQDHDLIKGNSYSRNKKTNLTFSEFFQVLRELGFYTLKKGEIEYNDAVLTKYLHEVSRRLPHITFQPHNFIEDLVKAVPLFNKEGLEYRWAHKSFQEYFAAEFICRDSKENQLNILKTMYESSKSEKFMFVFSLCYDIDFKSFREALLIPYLEDFIRYYEGTFDSLSINPQLSAKEIEVRKILTYNRVHLVVTNRQDKDLRIILEAVNSMSKEPGQTKFKGLPDFVPEKYRLRMLTFGDDMVLTSLKANDLTELLINKKSPVVGPIKIKKSTIKREDFFNGKELPKFLIIDDRLNETNQDSLNLEFFNSLINNNLYKEHSRNIHLDYKKCKKFISDFNREIDFDDNEYMLSGF